MLMCKIDISYMYAMTFQFSESCLHAHHTATNATFPIAVNIAKCCLCVFFSLLLIVVVVGGDVDVEMISSHFISVKGGWCNVVSPSKCHQHVIRALGLLCFVVEKS